MVDNAHDRRTLEQRLQWIADWSEPGIDLADAGTAREVVERINAQAIRIRQLVERIKALEAALKWRPSRWDYDRIASYDDAVRNWEAQAKAALGQGGVRSDYSGGGLVALDDLISAAIAHAECYATEDGDPRRRYTPAQMEIALRNLSRTLTPGGNHG